ncbi:MAG: hypothetical protein IT561_13960 [Alphaproteobacteria bacterium]|nr:hypothetical protein [Alphaproteobacteria bacterium]
MTDTPPTDEQEVALLREIEARAATLSRCADPLMQGQYRHLLGRVTALLAIKGAMPGGEPR